MKKCMQCGGAKKMQKGGSTMKTTVGSATPKGQIYGIPNAGSTGPNRQGIDTMKKGGSTSGAVQTSCKNGLVRMPDGRCGTRETPSFKKGGSTFGMLSVKAGVDKNPKATAADRIAGAKMSKKKMGGATKKKC
jgi:hypothetical protein